MFVVLGKDLFVVQISIQKYYWWRLTYHWYVHVRIGLFLACLLLLATIQLNYWTRLADDTLWNPLLKFFRSWIQCTWAGSNLLLYQPFKIILSLKTITLWHKRWQLFSSVAWKEITKATFLVQMVLIAVALTSYRGACLELNFL